MKNKFYIYLLAVTAAAYAIINLLVFTFIDFARLNNAQFWISWAFMFGLNSIMTIAVGLKIRKKDPHDIRLYPFTLLLGGNIAYLILGIIFTWLLPKVLYVVIVDIIVAIIYALVAFRFVLAVSYVRDGDAARRKKIAYIRQMTTMVESYASLAPDADTADSVKKLSADFRYSDPMSHESLAGVEQKLMEMVISLEDAVRGGDKEKIDAQIAEVRRELKLRNAMCANLK